LKILVAGGEGYLGSLVCNSLVEKHEVTSVDIGWFKTDLNSKIERLNKDIFDLCDLNSYDAVIFLAGLSNDPMSDFDPKNSFAQNVGSLFHLAKVAKKSGCKRFIYANSCSIYGWQDKEVCENDISLSETYYGVSKNLGEISLNSLADENFSVCTFRMGTLSGHSPRMRFDLIINTMYRSIKKYNKITIHDPDIWRPILDIRDAARAYQFAIDHPVPLKGVFNLAYGNYQIKEIGLIFQDLTKCNVETIYKKDIRNYRINTGKIRNLLFEFLYSPKDTVIDLMSRNYDDLDSDKFFNIKSYRKINEKK
jgi:nucleoside-diphosphate-sugar epimerase